MHIPSHQIHNVLKAYKRLIVKKMEDDGQAFAKASVAYASKRRAVSEKIIRDISGRIMIPQTKTRPTEAPPAPEKEKAAYPFVYNTVTSQGAKMTRQLTMEAADFLLKSLERLAEEAPEGPEGENP